MKANQNVSECSAVKVVLCDFLWNSLGCFGLLERALLPAAGGMPEQHTRDVSAALPEVQIPMSIEEIRTMLDKGDDDLVLQAQLPSPSKSRVLIGHSQVSWTQGMPRSHRRP